MQAGESDLFSMVKPTGEDTEVALLSCKFLPYAWIEAGRLIVWLSVEMFRRFSWLYTQSQIQIARCQLTYPFYLFASF